MSGDVNKLCLDCMQYTLNGAGVCGHCGAVLNTQPALPHHLGPRTVLNGKYLVAKVLGEGGFGITYLGWDINLEVKVAIKEYYPLGAVTRNITINDQITALSGDATEVFNQGRDRFVDEARRLARFQSLPGIVAVKDYFTANGTAYIVMEFVEGVTFKDYLEQNGGRMDEVAVLELMKPLVQSIAEVHQFGIIHRDISPDNIMLTPNGQLHLIDFGAARDFAADEKSLSVLLKPGYAPEEQYRSRGNQGPWTDVYALSATIFRAIEGDKPPEAMERMFDDAFAGFTVPVSENTCAVLMKGLAVRHPQRWQNMEELHAALYGPGGAQAAPGSTAPQNPAMATSSPPASKMAKPKNKRAPIIVAIVLGLAVVLALAIQQAVSGGNNSKGDIVSAEGPAVTGADSQAQQVESGPQQLTLGDVTPAGYSLSVEIQDDTHATIHLTDPYLEPGYAKNVTEQGLQSYGWSVTFGGKDDKEFEVLAILKFSKGPELNPPLELVGDFWMGPWHRGAEPMKEKGTTLVWEVELPALYQNDYPDFSFYSFTQYIATVSRPNKNWRETFYAPGALDALVASAEDPITTTHIAVLFGGPYDLELTTAYDYIHDTYDTLLEKYQANDGFEAAFEAERVEFNEVNGKPDAPETYTFTRGEMDLAYEKAAMALKVDEMSEPVKTDDGYFIILRIK